MVKVLEYFRHSIKRRMVSMMMGSLLLILIGAIIMPWSTFRNVQDYDNAARHLNENQEHITSIVNHTNEIILRVRGYFAYLDNYEYEQIFVAKDELEKSLTAFKSTALTADEQELVRRIESYFENYINDVLPKGAAFAQKGDYESLRELITLGASNPTNEIILYAQNSEEVIREQLVLENEKLFKSLLLQGVYFVIYSLFVLLFSLIITRKMAKDIGIPLSELSHYALNYTRDSSIEGAMLERKDEIGLLSRSLHNMIYDIREKKEELLAQNEELQAQQDELQAQQEELQKALGKMEENEVYLNKRNLLAQSLANTLDKKELLDSIIRSVVEISRTEKGILVLMNESHNYAAHGISQEEAQQFRDHIGGSAVIRAIETKKVYVRERAATTDEKGYLSGELSAYDIFVPIMKGNGEAAAFMVLTRVGMVIHRREEQEIIGLAGQISLSLEKLEMFEAIESQRQMTQDMLNTIQEGVQLMNLDGQSLQINEKLYELMDLSYDRSELKSMSLSNFKQLLKSRVDDPEELFIFIDHALSGETDQAQSMSYVLKGEDTRYIGIYWEPIFRNNIQIGILLVHRDMTKEHEVDRMKSEFVSTVSHELRTPLASILGFSELLLHRELKPERQRKYMATIHQEAQRLTQLVNDFLDLQRMETGIQYYNLQPVDMISLIKEVQELQQAITAQHTITLHSNNENSIVFGDKDKLLQVLVNLVGNAIKYSPKGGHIQITAQHVGDDLCVDVSDEGLGIPEQAIPNLFTKFYRVDNSDRREIGGTGLGLAIVKEIVNRHQGQVSVRTELGVGSTFSIMLPSHQKSSVRDSEDVLMNDSQEASSLEVMLIENDYSLSVMLQDELVERGYRTTLFTDGMSALDAMEARRPDIIILDLKLAVDMSGWEVIERMKSSPKLKDILIIISSAFEEKERAAQLGINHFLIKPYVPFKLIEAIEDIMSIHKEQAIDK